MANTETKDVMQLPEAQQKQWLEQRGWIPSQRDNIILWRHPETGIRYVFPMAFKLAIQDCRLPADFQLTPEIKRSTPGETITDKPVVPSADAPKV